MEKIHYRGFWRSLNQAWRGLHYVWKTEGHMQFHAFAGVLVLVGAWWLKLARWEWLLLFYAIGSVFLSEVLNTAVELVVDLVQPNFHPLAGMAKDVAAGAVLVTVIQAVVIGIGLFWLPLWHWIGG
ncbi:undecaprenol kinase [Peptococcaceae bacterium CEB3]|nr:undecaprenol kinase [Peptococcaceae bacterium CEB3]